MDSSKINDWMQVVGIFALVGSLVFVGLQLKQSQDIAIAAQYQARTEATLNLYSVHIESGFALRPFREHLSETITAQDASMTAWAWVAYDNHHFQYQNGFLTEDSWRGHLNSMKGTYNSCQMRFVYEARKNSMRSEFVALVDSWEDRCSMPAGL